RNYIRSNGGDGVWVESGRQNLILRNEILLNDGKPIHLSDGANDNVQPPVLDFSAAGSTRVKGRLVGAKTNTTYTVRVQAKISSYAGPNNPTHVRTIEVGDVQVTTDRNGNTTFDKTFPIDLPERSDDDDDNPFAPSTDVYATVTC